jgi:hypothetical protein
MGGVRFLACNVVIDVERVLNLASCGLGQLDFARRLRRSRKFLLLQLDLLLLQLPASRVEIV